MLLIESTSELAKLSEEEIKTRSRIKNFVIDSRQVKNNSVFIALKGNNLDGNDFVYDALEKGACLAVTDNKNFKEDTNKNILYVNDTYRFLLKTSQNLAENFNGIKIGITGSNGKTSTTQILSHVIESSSSTIKNFNNEIGMLLSILDTKYDSKVLVIEMGARKLGDIDFLSSILKPHIGIITNIGNSHIENLKNLDGVLKVKSELVNNIIKNGSLIVPGDNNKHLNFWKSLRKDITVFSFGLDNTNHYYPKEMASNLDGLSFNIKNNITGKSIKINSKLIGDHNILNILASYAAIFAGSLDENYFAKSIEDFQNPERQKIMDWINGCTLFNDTYNANPESMKSAIKTICKSEKRKIVIFGDMFELGKDEVYLHQEVGKYAKVEGVDIFIGFGKLAKHAVNSFGKNSKFFENEDELKKYIIDNIRNTDFVLLKGSRGMRMERFLNV